MKVRNYKPEVEKHLILVGGGHSHAILLNRLKANPIPNARITVVSDTRYAAYSGMLPGLIAGYYNFSDTHIDIEQLVSCAGARFILGSVWGIDLKQKMVILADETRIPFDVISINTGSTPPLAQTPGAASHVIPVKPVAGLLAALQSIDRIQNDGCSRRFCIVGGGAGGVEIAFALRARFASSSIQLFQSDRQVLPAYPEAARSYIVRQLAEAQIEVTTNSRVRSVERKVLRLDSGVSVSFDWCIWSTGSSAPSWIKSSGLATDSNGFIEVTSTLQSISHDFVFAAGDVASIRDQPRPKSGVFAVRQGIPLYRNLTSFVSGQKLRPYKFQRRLLSIIGTHPERGVAIRGNLVCEGTLMWRLKEWIDRRFMKRFI